MRFEQELRHQLARGWRTLGLPVAAGRIDEGEDGVVDPEALLHLSAEWLTGDRIWQDVCVWFASFNNLVIHQKLRSLEIELSRFTTQSAPADRTRKLAGRRVVAQQSRFIYNRLLYGVGFRADLITLIESDAAPRTGRRLAALLGTNPSTVSRVLRDLEAIQVLRNIEEHVLPRRKAGSFISVATLRSVQALAAANLVTDPALREAMLPDPEPSEDRLGRMLARRMSGRR